MHQPVYRDGSTRSYTAPWVRLHGVRDYLHMAEVVGRHPNVHITVNFVPALLEQIEDYASGRAVDPDLALSRQDHWTPAEQAELLERFFRVSEQTVLSRFPGYARLKRLRDAAEGDPSFLSPVFFRDLVAWFNLAWIDASTIERRPELQALAHRGGRFSMSDVGLILAAQDEVIRQIVPTYRSLAKSGQVELTTSPYYHPVMPLLYNQDTARVASPGLALPEMRFAEPDDAREHLRRGIQSHLRTFGILPKGLWPPEGAVSSAMLPDVAASGLSWLASDEEVLARSLGVDFRRDGRGNVLNPEVLYRPYDIYVGRTRLSLVFRDRALSDLIGFAYRHMDGRQAAEDLIERLHGIRRRLDSASSRSLVVIALDGENCWGGYQGNGEAFLDRLYGLLDEKTGLRAVTVSEHLRQLPSSVSLERLEAGTWVPNGFSTWIGGQAQNRAWDLLSRTRADLMTRQHRDGLDPAALSKAWQQVYISEGSDWFWWYSHHNAIEGRSPYDDLYRSQLRAVYRLVGQEPPGWLNRPVSVTESQE